MTTRDATGILDRVARAQLLDIARSRLDTFLAQQRFVLPERLSDQLLECRPAFVTLRKEGKLRGCIGSLEPEQDLARDIPRLVVAAATKDPRFPRLDPVELPDIRIEISVLTNPLPISNIQDIELRRHGIKVASEGARAVMLPGVATKHEWTREMLLSHTCRKAGLPLEAWKSDAQVSVFESIVIEEPEAR